MPKSIYRHFRQRKFRNLTEDASRPIPDYVPEDSLEAGEGLTPPSNEEEQQEDSYEIEENSTFGIFDDSEKIEWKKQLEEVPDDVLQFIDASCQSKLSQKEFRRFLSVHNFDFEKRVYDLWNAKHNLYSTTFTCNSCGMNLNRNETCCGPVVKFVRIGIQSQLRDLVEEHLSEIIPSDLHGTLSCTTS